MSNHDSYASAGTPISLPIDLHLLDDIKHGEPEPATEHDAALMRVDGAVYQRR